MRLGAPLWAAKQRRAVDQREVLQPVALLQVGCPAPRGLAANNNCGLEHEAQSPYGENLAMGTKLTPQAAVDMWAGEKSKYTWSATYTMADFNAGSGHYTQLVWRTSIQIGCGSATCGNVVVISCRYSAPGNYIGKAVY
jgi:pathogenesis-related protein 1